MPQIAQLIGGAGTGKTTELLRIMASVIERGIDPFAVGFVSFTRAARSEAASRAAQQFGVPVDRLEQEGWFRTLHSICYKCLGVGKELLTDTRESRQWIEAATQAEVTGAREQQPDGAFEAGTQADRALQIWDCARARLTPFRDAWELNSLCDDNCPPLDFCEALIERYEQSKRLDGRVDFTDILGRYAGVKFYFDGPRDSKPDGWIPEAPVWFFDEQQDASALLDKVCHRLITPAEWVYVVGDPFQAIYGFAGADSKYFMGWPVPEHKRRIMPKSYRCPAPVHLLGESILQGCSDYWNRGIQPADHAGDVARLSYDARLANMVNPTESWLLIARSNFQAGRMATLLNRAGIPWIPTRGPGGWDAPARNAALEALLDLEFGEPIDGTQWKSVLKHLPSKADDAQLLVRGTKARFDDDKYPAAEKHPYVRVNELDQLGATQELIKRVSDGRWRSLIDKGEQYAQAVERWGQSVVRNPRVRVGTIHSVKGAEADNVALLTTISLPVVRGQGTEQGRNEEHRVFYVGATRARKNLYVVHEHRARYAMRLPI